MIQSKDRRKKMFKYQGSMDRLRIAVHRTNKFVYAQAIDDVARTIAAVSTEINRQEETEIKLKTKAGRLPKKR
jgi:ribosomal protein L18